MQTFVWKPEFDTGIETVDQQHHQLVNLVNRLGTVVFDGRNFESAVVPILGELAEYASNHFSDEECLMEDCGVDRRHIVHHQLQHSQFIDEVEKIFALSSTQQNPIETVGTFLSSWLVNHILEEDQSMARQIVMIKNGATPNAAYDNEGLSK
jgi:hemerythrin-like metal-binding protein